MDIHETPTADLHEQLRTRKLSCEEVTTHFLARIDAIDPDCNAFSCVTRDAAISRARELDQKWAANHTPGPLAGLPIALKDNICQRDVPTTCGSETLRNFKPPYDAHVVERIHQDDGIVLGRVNLDEFAMGSSTETSIFGPVHNPWDTDRTAGGSSGGAAAAVAAGLVPLALGSDTGGSIRQPASFCGVTGLKPTYGRVSRYGLIAYASSLDQIGPLSRDAYGCRLVLNTIAGHDGRDSTSLAADVPKFPPDANPGLNGIRVGVVEEHYGEGISSEVAAATEQAIEQLADAGAVVQRIHLPHARYCVATYYLIACSEASSNLARFDGVHYGHRSEHFSNLVDLYCQSRAEGFGAEVKRRIMLGTYALSAGYYDEFYLRALKVRRRIREDFDTAFQNVDVIAGPVAPTPAFRLGEKLDDPLAMYLNDIYTLSANLAGIPAISVPCGHSSTGLPIGLQLMARPLEEATLLNVAETYQQLTSWHREISAMAGG
jgi:aspartyl-tRNA(Asn)/glutamyl-tRNA(Gln) amidotransferase subunit A